MTGEPVTGQRQQTDRTRRALEIVDLIYRAATDPNGWTLVAEALSGELGGAAVGVALSLPQLAPPGRFYGVGFRPEFDDCFTEHYRRGLPWGAGFVSRFVGRFGRGSEVFPDEEIADTDLYKEWMEPHGFAAACPLVHSIAVEDGRRVAGMGIYRRVGGRAFDDADLAFLDLFVPHLGRAYSLYRTMGGEHRARLALAEVVDRLPTGVILIDAEGRPLVRNRAADRILAQDDGFRLEADGPHAADPREHAALRQLVEAAVTPARGGERETEAVIAVTRPSGRRPFTVFVTPLLEVPYEPMAPDAAAAIFVSDPDSAPITTLGVLQNLYSLTRAEAELVQLLARGCSLDEVAQLRGVTRHTARSQLKQVFAKTDTKRQGELVRLVLTGIASVDGK